MPSRGSESWWGVQGKEAPSCSLKSPLFALEATSDDEWYWVSPTRPTRTSTCREDLPCQADTINSLSEAGNGADTLRAFLSVTQRCSELAGAWLPLQAFLFPIITQRAKYSAGL